MLRGFKARNPTYAKVTVANSRAVWRAFRAGPVRAETSQKNPPSQIPANAVRSPVATSASSTTPVAPQRNAPRRPAHPQMPKAAELKKEATKRGFPRLPALRILPGAEAPPKSQGRSKRTIQPEQQSSTPAKRPRLLRATTQPCCGVAASQQPLHEPTSASGRQPTAHPRATSVAISRAAIHPAVVLAVCPLLASPFAAAKGGTLLAFGALACWLGRDDSVSNSEGGSTGAHFPRILFLLCLAGWIAALLIATLVARGWAVGWRPLAEIGSAVVVAAAMRQLHTRAESLLGAIAVSSLVLSFVVLVGWFGFDLPWLFGGASAPGRMRSAGTLGNPLFVASFLSSAVFGICGWTRTSGRVSLGSGWRSCCWRSLRRESAPR